MPNVHLVSVLTQRLAVQVLKSAVTPSEGLCRYPADWERRKEEEQSEQNELAARAPKGLFSFLHHNSLPPGGAQS